MGDPLSVLRPEVAHAVAETARLGGASATGVSAVDPATGAMAPLWASDDRVAELQAVERALGAGPELEAARGGRWWSPDQVPGAGWPVLAARARDLGFVGGGAVRHTSPAGPTFVLVLWTTGVGRLEEGALDAAARVLRECLLLQDAADRAVRESVELRAGMETRALIGQAVGILVERLRVPADGAFGVLRDVSQRRNVKLREVADHLVRTGELLPTRKEARPVGVRCLVCGSTLPTGLVRLGNGDQGLAYTCPHCEKSIEFAPVSAMAERRTEVAKRRLELGGTRPPV